MNTKYILFDLDGTVTDPGIGITNSVMYALDRLGLKYSCREELYKFIGPPLISSFMEFYNLTRAEAENAVKLYREYYSVSGLYENSVYPGIPELLRKLKDTGYSLLVATSKPEAFAKTIFRHFCLDEYFDIIAGAAMDETRSEKHEVIAYALSSLGIENTGECIMVGDRKYDIEGAKRFGMKSIGVTYGYGTKEELIAAGADFIADNAEDILKIISSDSEA